MPRERMGSGTDLVVVCHAQGWAATRGRVRRGTDLVVVCHAQGWAATRGRVRRGTDLVVVCHAQGGQRHARGCVVERLAFDISALTPTSDQ
jgi:hypothetical protein